MNIKTLRLVALVGLVAMAFSSCGAKLRPLQSEQVQVDPTPLTLVGGQVPAEVRIAFPAKSFPKKATLRVTPVLRYQGGEKWGQSYRYQGESVRGNEVTIPYKRGANVALRFAVPYTSQMQKSELYLVFEAKVGNKTVKLPDLKVGSGVLATEALATARGVLPAIAPHGFERIIKQAYDADIMFQIQQANVRNSEFKKEDVEEWRYIVQNANETPDQKVNVEVQAYASPDGGAKLNERLSESRERNTSKSLKQDFKRNNMGNVAVDAHYTAQDWEGFRKLVEASNLPDKELVLRVLSMYPDAESREREIKNISAVFRQLADEVLPKLRRSRLVAHVEIIGKSDEEIAQWLEKAPGYLTIEELLYAATLVGNDEEKIRILQLVAQKYPRDYKAFNNIGALLFAQGKAEQAEVWFAEAAKRSNGNAVTKLNQGLMALLKGKTEEATPLIAAGSELPEGAQALAFLYLKEGDYAKAVTAYGNTVSDNAVVAQILSGDYAKAQTLLSSMTQPSATSYLLSAVVAARTNDVARLTSALREALTLKPSLASEVVNNLEFARYINLPEISQLLVSAGR